MSKPPTAKVGQKFTDCSCSPFGSCLFNNNKAEKIASNSFLYLIEQNKDVWGSRDIVLSTGWRWTAAQPSQCYFLVPTKLGGSHNWPGCSG